MTDQSFADEIASTGTVHSSAFHVPPDFAPPKIASLLLQAALTINILAQAAACAIIAISADFILRALNGEFESEEQYLQQASWMLPLADLAMPVGIGALVMCIAAYCFFVYRAASNIQNAKARGHDHSPLASVGLGFVPLANLVFIFNIMKGIWVASHDPKRGVYAMSVLLPVWWGLYLVSNIVSRFSTNMMDSALDAENFDGFITMSWITIGAGAGLIISCITLIIIVRAITRAQSNWPTLAA